MLSSKLNILSHNSIPNDQIWKIPSQTGITFWDNCFEYQQPYVIFKIENFIPHFYLSQYYLFFVYISHIFYFSSAILIALNDNLELYVDLETSSKIKLICIPTHYYWSVPFSAVNSIFFLLFHVYARYMWLRYYSYIFCTYYHLRFLSPYDYQSEVNLGGPTLDMDLDPDP